MLDQRFINNYSSIIVENEKDVLEDFYNECLVWKDIFKKEPFLLKYLDDNIVLSPTRDKSLVESLFSFARLSWRYLQFLIKENKCKYWAKIVDNCIMRYKKIKRIGIVDITSVVPLDENNKIKLKQYLISKFKLNDLEINNHIDASIINGLIIYLDGVRIDYSLKRLFV